MRITPHTSAARPLARFVLITSLLFTAGIAGAGVATAEPAAGSVATTASAAADVQCGGITCNYVFSRAVTNDIATGGALTAACAAVPTPGNIACGIAGASLVATANAAKNRNQCAAITWTTTPPPAFTWFPSVDGGPRCK